MPLRLPPLPALRLFEAAGRLGSFKLAAEELHLTPSAVSHGVSALERTLGVVLFVRRPRGLALTAEGAGYLSYVADALALIATGTDRLPGRQTPRPITLSCAPTLASRWLMPRLPGFRGALGVAPIMIDTSRRQVGFPVDGFDFAMRMSPAAVADPSWTKLFGEALAPVCSPAYRATLTDADGDLDLSRASLIHVGPASEDWEAWLDRTGSQPLALDGGLRVDTIELAFEAAAMGCGVAMGRRPLVDRDLAAGRLVELGPPPVAADTAYWLVSSEAVRHRADLVAFERWLLSECGVVDR